MMFISLLVVWVSSCCLHCYAVFFFFFGSEILGSVDFTFFILNCSIILEVFLLECIQQFYIFRVWGIGLLCRLHYSFLLGMAGLTKNYRFLYICLFSGLFIGNNSFLRSQFSFSFSIPLLSYSFLTVLPYLLDMPLRTISISLGSLHHGL